MKTIVLFLLLLAVPAVSSAKEELCLDEPAKTEEPKKQFVAPPTVTGNQDVTRMSPMFGGSPDWLLKKLKAQKQAQEAAARAAAAAEAEKK